MHTQAFVILRGCENLPVTVGPTTLPANARLRLHKIENTVFTPLSWVPLVDIPTGNGLIYLVALAAQSASYQFWEGCVHLHTPHQQPFPGTVLSTGTEDYFDSAFGFDAGLYHYPTAGCTHRKGGLPAGLPHTGSGFPLLCLFFACFCVPPPLFFSLLFLERFYGWDYYLFIYAFLQS